MRTQMLTVACCCTAMLVSGACSRSEPKEAPPAETTAQTPAVPQNNPMTLTGCLRAGEAGDTFVLTTAQAQDSAETATYHLTGAQGVNLRDHVGQRVEVSGVVRSEQEMASSSASRPAANEKATGTAGAPTVQTRTQLQVRQLDVNSIKAAGGKCE